MRSDCTRQRDSPRRGHDQTHQDDDTETTRRQQPVHPGFDLVRLDVVTRRNDTAFVETPNELDDDLP